MNKVERYNLPEELIHEEIKKLEKERVVERIQQHDHTLWKDDPEEIGNRLGWLNSHEKMIGALGEIHDLTEEIRQAGYTDALLLGMGGSSMAPEVYRKIFGVKTGYLELNILDSTDPGAILGKEKKLDFSKTLFIVSTKSGGTVETFSLMKYFYNRSIEILGRHSAGEHFIAITDPGSGMEKAARELDFRKIFLNDPEIGGRYSALSYFGLVPAGLIGANLDLLLKNAVIAAQEATGGSALVNEDNPAWLGAAAGACAKAGRDKLTFIFPAGLQPFGAWLEQLIAESTGKEGKGILPVDGETLASPAVYSGDRLFIYYNMAKDKTNHPKVQALIEGGHPVIEIKIKENYALGGEIFRWMLATAVAGWSMKINPFDQPNVEAAKVQARSLVAEYSEKGVLPTVPRDLNVEGIEVFSGFKKKDLHETWQEFLKSLKPGDKDCRGRSYISLQAYLTPTPATDHALQALRDKLQEDYRVAVTVGYGPRFLHSTGQLHKGDAGNGLFIQLTGKMPEDIAIPENPGSSSSSVTFGVLKSAQALGDRQALLDAGRKVITFYFKINTEKAIGKLINYL
ncbi:MAG: glucose-6-phosphate isomerase [Firmicutes bacterium]|nr:glucose-6-phosphate isomerase [Bacillota bacterium]